MIHCSGCDAELVDDTTLPYSVKLIRCSSCSTQYRVKKSLDGLSVTEVDRACYSTNDSTLRTQITREPKPFVSNPTWTDRNINDPKPTGLLRCFSCDTPIDSTTALTANVVVGFFKRSHEKLRDGHKVEATVTLPTYKQSKLCKECFDRLTKQEWEDYRGLHKSADPRYPDIDPRMPSTITGKAINPRREATEVDSVDKTTVHYIRGEKIEFEDLTPKIRLDLCSECHGKGKVTETQIVIWGETSKKEVTCYKCKGTGKDVDPQSYNRFALPESNKWRNSL